MMYERLFGLSRDYLLVKVPLCVPLSSLGLLELDYGTSGPNFYISKCS